jgi:hypothetical protein
MLLGFGDNDATDLTDVFVDVSGKLRVNSVMSVNGHRGLMLM